MPTVVLNPPSKSKTEPDSTANSNNNNNDDDDEDHVTSAIRKTGCFQFHEKLQECYIEKRDWRQCIKEMQDFRQCMKRIQQTTLPSPPSSSSTPQ